VFDKYVRPPLVGGSTKSFPPTQGLPEIFPQNEIDGSGARSPPQEKGTIRLCPEPPLVSGQFRGAPSPMGRELRMMSPDCRGKWCYNQSSEKRSSSARWWAKRPGTSAIGNWTSAIRRDRLSLTRLSDSYAQTRKVLENPGRSMLATTLSPSPWAGVGRRTKDEGGPSSDHTEIRMAMMG
jgi:hypothetical protein